LVTGALLTNHLFISSIETVKDKKEFYNLIVDINDALISLKLMLFQISTNAQALLITATQMRPVLTQKVHSLVAATKDLPGTAFNARVCSFCAVNEKTYLNWHWGVVEEKSKLNVEFK